MSTGHRQTRPMAGYVYRAFDAAGRLLYVGITRDVLQRLKQHARTQTWWSEVFTVTAEEFTNDYLARIAERVTILDECPLHNRTRKSVTDSDRSVTARNRRLSLGITTAYQAESVGSDRK